MTVTATTSGLARRAAVPGDGLLHPIPLVALVLLVANDHAWKGVGPAPVTGILSGIAGLVLTPLVLVALWEVARVAIGAPWRPAVPVLVVACAATGVGYAAVEIVPAATEAYRQLWGWMQWPGAMIVSMWSAGPMPAMTPVAAVADPFDLAALPALWLAWRAGRPRTIRPA